MRVRTFEDRVLGGIFGCKGDEVTGGYKVLHNEEHQTYQMRWLGHVTRIGVKRSTYKTLIGRPGEKKRLLGRLKLQCKGNIRMDLKEIG
jgi:hypothetical protein